MKKIISLLLSLGFIFASDATSFAESVTLKAIGKGADKMKVRGIIEIIIALAIAICVLWVIISVLGASFFQQYGAR
ncbi:MAG: hypothetical protein PHX20_05985 [Candidatus Omnitrophica bacterium]|nr:hypothetical protein [Candidatus Omnitrophota bacterium]MDD5437076.1 hypothetical protein [Candidatus Omnitrophota bacterium]